MPTEVVDSMEADTSPRGHELHHQMGWARPAGSPDSNKRAKVGQPPQQPQGTEGWLTPPVEAGDGAQEEAVRED